MGGFSRIDRPTCRNSVCLCRCRDCAREGTRIGRPVSAVGPDGSRFPNGCCAGCSRDCIDWIVGGSTRRTDRGVDSAAPAPAGVQHPGRGGAGRMVTCEGLRLLVVGFGHSRWLRGLVSAGALGGLHLSAALGGAGLIVIAVVSGIVLRRQLPPVQILARYRSNG